MSASRTSKTTWSSSSIIASCTMGQTVKLGASAWRCTQSIRTLPSNCTSIFISVSDCIKKSFSYFSVCLALFVCVASFINSIINYK